MQALDQNSGSAAAVRLPRLAIFSPNTEERLQLYFARRGQLDAANDAPSSFWAMCDRAHRVAHSSVPCDECELTGSSRLSPEELTERARRISREKAEWAAMRVDATPKELLDIDEQIERQRKDLNDLLANEAACKKCHGTGYTDPRRIPRGKGDSVSTTMRCAPCGASGRVNRPLVWNIQRTLRELELELGSYLAAEDIVSVARDIASQLEGPSRWTATLEIMRRLAYSGLPGAVEHRDGAAPALRWDSAEAFAGLRALMSDPCGKCDGAGYWMPITVRETGSSVPHGAQQPNVSLVREHGAIDRIFWMLFARNATSAATLETYFGPMGNRWGHTSYRREFSLWPYTKPGAQLAKEAGKQFEKDHHTTLTPHELLKRELDEDRSSALVNVRRRAFLDQAAKAALGMIERSKREWSKVVIEVQGVSRDESDELADVVADCQVADAIEDGVWRAQDDARASAELAGHYSESEKRRASQGSEEVFLRRK